MKFSTLLLTPLFVCTSAVLADEDDHDDHGDHHGEEHYDIGLYASNGAMTVGGWDHDTESMEVANLRLFEAHFGEDPAFPYSIDEPGIGGTADLLGMAPGGSFSMNLIAGVRAWDGSGFSSSAESMGVSFGPASVDAALGGSIAFTATEDFDLHPEYFIDSGAATGSYLLESHSALQDLPLRSRFTLSSTTAWTTSSLKRPSNGPKPTSCLSTVHGCFSVASASVVATVAAD